MSWVTGPDGGTGRGAADGLQLGTGIGGRAPDRSGVG